ncbi:4-carboxymuconolactone decarboxylase [Artomyces pyxidatus]|uniref:4-carboxymuconolactone decarboxylase n=1 Tax=Artomyces pyxidatus TaxID=48021 RepID=A0ACB8TB87_9AGAM|nr:4-carboxymuconolactone decarboxylase [Artomyces pyxidatus]
MLLSVYLTSIVAIYGLAATTQAKSMASQEKRDDNLPARVPYVFPSPGTDAVADALRARRPNNTLLDLDGVLLNVEPLASSWNDIAAVIRDNNTIPGTMRELLILRSAVLNKAAYQWIQHEPVGRSEGLTTAQLLTIRFAPPFVGSIDAFSPTSSQGESTLSSELKAALDFADWSTSAVYVPTQIYHNLRKFLSDKQMVEAMATVGMYSFVSRFVVGLNIDDKMDVPVPIPQ